MGGWMKDCARTLGLLVVLLPGALEPCVRASQDDPDSRQVTLFAVIASKENGTIDPKLSKVAPQLRKLLPNHVFRLLSVKTKRLMAGQTLTVKLDDGLTAATTLDEAVDDNGKVQVRCALVQDGTPQTATVVATPPNQLLFCDKLRDDGSRLLIGIGAR